MQTKFLPYIVIGILVIAGVVGASYYYFVIKQPVEIPSPLSSPEQPLPPPEEKPQEETPPEEIPADETANWKVYRNEKYGFEVKYPADSDFDSIDYTEPADLIKHNIDPKYSAGNLLLIVNFRFSDRVTYPYSLLCADYEIEVRKTDYSDINNWVEDVRQRVETPSEYEEGAMVSGKLSSIEDIEIQGRAAKRITIEGGFPFWTAQLGVIKEGKLYTINYLDMSFGSDRPGCLADVEQGEAKYKDIFDKILSTFRFSP